MTELSTGDVIVLHSYDVKLVTALRNIQRCCIKRKLFGTVTVITAIKLIYPWNYLELKMTEKQVKWLLIMKPRKPTTPRT
jgi:hypothetical protein